jgi:CubicO group peptidase (beta-lactamase class C family)
MHGMARAPIAFVLFACVSCAGATPAPGSPSPAPVSTPLPAPAPSPAPAPQDTLASKIDPIFADLTKPGSPGCAVGVYRAGEIVFARGYGLASIEHQIPIAKDTVFDIGSVSKQFTAMAVLLLAKDGKLSLDDDVRKYVPEVPVYGKPITLRHLLHHTSGLRDYAGLLTIEGFDVADVTNDDDGLFVVAHQKALNFPTGTEWSYSNTGYFLLSLVVKRASGRTLAAFAKERIFDPLEMHSTFYLDDHRAIVPHRATGYEPRDDGGLAVSMSDFEQTGDGAVQTSVEDLARWDANFYEPKVGTQETLALLRTPGKLDDGKPVTYAMGLDESTQNGVAREEHNGAWAGYRADVLRFPSERLAVACLCNLGDAAPEERADAVAKALLPKLAESAPAAPRASSSPNGYTPSPADLAPVIGAYYNTATYEIRRISLDKGAIVLDFQLGDGGTRRQLEALDARTFVVLGVPAAIATRYRYEPASGKAPARLVRMPVNGKTTTFERAEPVTLAPPALEEYAGRYTSDESVHDIQVGVKDGKLVLGPWGRTLGAHPRPLARDVFTLTGAGLCFQRDGRGRVRGFELGGDRLLHMQWVKRDGNK